MRVSLKKMDNSKTMISGGFPHLANHRFFFAVAKTIVMISIKITPSIRKLSGSYISKINFSHEMSYTSSEFYESVHVSLIKKPERGGTQPLHERSFIMTIFSWRKGLKRYFCRKWLKRELNLYRLHRYVQRLFMCSTATQNWCISY